MTDNQPLTKEFLGVDGYFLHDDVRSAVEGLKNDLLEAGVFAQQNENSQYDAAIQFAEELTLKWFPVFAEKDTHNNNYQNDSVLRG